MLVAFSDFETDVHKMSTLVNGGPLLGVGYGGEGESVKHIGSRSVISDQRVGDVHINKMASNRGVGYGTHDVLHANTTSFGGSKRGGPEKRKTLQAQIQQII